MTSDGSQNRSAEGAAMGAPIAITLYGLVVVAVSAFADKELVPHSNGKAALILVAVSVVGVILGAGFDRRPRRG